MSKCSDLRDFVESPETQRVFNELIKATDKDGLERGLDIQELDGKFYLGSICTGNECSIHIPMSLNRVGSFHTHPGKEYTLEDVYPKETYSTGDLLNALWDDYSISCVGRMVKEEFEDPKETRKPYITCYCLKPEGFKQWLIDNFIDFSELMT